MTHFLSGFVDELVKVGAFAQQHGDAGPYDSAATVSKALNQSPATTKASGPVQPPPVEKKRAPTPLTTPNHNLDYASRS